MYKEKKTFCEKRNSPDVKQNSGFIFVKRLI